VIVYSCRLKLVESRAPGPLVVIANLAEAVIAGTARTLR